MTEDERFMAWLGRNWLDAELSDDHYRAKGLGVDYDRWTAHWNTTNEPDYTDEEILALVRWLYSEERSGRR